MKRNWGKKETKKSIFIKEIKMYGFIRMLLLQTYGISVPHPLCLSQICSVIQKEKYSKLYERQILWPIQQKFLKELIEKLTLLSKSKEKNNKNLISISLDLHFMIDIFKKRVSQYKEQVQQNLLKQFERELQFISSQFSKIKMKQKKIYSTQNIEYVVPEDRESTNQKQIINISFVLSKKQSSNDVKSLRETGLGSQAHTGIQSSTKNSFLQQNLNSLSFNYPQKQKTERKYLKSAFKRKNISEQQSVFEKSHHQRQSTLEVKVKQEQTDEKIEKQQNNFEDEQITAKKTTKRKKRKRKNNELFNSAPNLQSIISSTDNNSNHLHNLITERNFKKTSLKRSQMKESSVKKVRTQVQSIRSNDSSKSKSRFFKRKHQYKGVKKVHRKRHNKIMEQIKQLPESLSSLALLKSHKTKQNFSRNVSIKFVQNGSDYLKYLRRVSKFKNTSQQLKSRKKDSFSKRSHIISRQENQIASSQNLNVMNLNKNEDDKGIVTHIDRKKLAFYFHQINNMKESVNESDFFKQQELIRMKQNQLFQYFLQQMKLKSSLSFRQPFPLQTNEEMVRQERLMASDRFLAFQNDEEWLKAFKIIIDQVDQKQMPWGIKKQV